MTQRHSIANCNGCKDSKGNTKASHAVTKNNGIILEIKANFARPLTRELLP